MMLALVVSIALVVGMIIVAVEQWRGTFDREPEEAEAGALKHVNKCEWPLRWR